MTLFICILWFICIPICLNILYEWITNKKKKEQPFDPKSFKYDFDDFKKDMNKKNIDI